MSENSEELIEESPGKKIYVIVAALLILFVMAVGCVGGLIFLLNKPLSPGLELTQSQEVATQVAGVMPPIREPVCSGTDSMVILVIGSDLPDTDFPKGADAIRFVQVDFVSQEVTILAIPRDLWVATPRLAAQGYFAETLGQTYYLGKNLAVSSEDESRLGTTMLAQTFYDNFGLAPDHYLTLNMEAFADMVDSIGGVRINVPQAFEGGEFSFPAGEQLFSGDMLTDYARTFLVGSEWDRLNRQDIVIEALKSTMLSGELISEIPSLFSQFSSVVATDLSPQQMISLGCMIQRVSNANTHYAEIPEAMTHVDENDHMLPATEDIATFISKLFGE